MTTMDAELQRRSVPFGAGFIYVVDAGCWAGHYGQWDGAGYSHMILANDAMRSDLAGRGVCFSVVDHETDAAATIRHLRRQLVAAMTGLDVCQLPEREGG